MAVKNRCAHKRAMMERKKMTRRLDRAAAKAANNGRHNGHRRGYEPKTEHHPNL